MCNKDLLYDKRYKQFRFSASCYKSQKEWLHHLESNHPWLVREDQKVYGAKELVRQYDSLQKQISQVDDILEQIECNYGKIAKDMIYMQFIDKEKQVYVCKLYGISLRTLQRRNHTWLSGVLNA